jgi:acyl carrier protein
MVLEKIKEVVAKKFKVQLENVSVTTRLREDLNVDSLDAVELIMELEDTFKVKISDDEAQKLKTIGDIVTFIEPKVKK